MSWVPSQDAIVAAARFGAEAALVAPVGAEDEGLARDLLRSVRVDGSWLQVVSGASGTFVFPRALDDAQPWPLFRPMESDVDRPLSPALPQAQVYLVFGIPDFEPVAAGWLDAAPREASMIWDRQGWLSRARDWTGLDVPTERRLYLANLDEALAEFGVETADDLWPHLPPDGYESAVVKEGAAGCSVVTSAAPSTVVTIAGFPVRTASTIGSGDVFAGVLAAKLAERNELQPALRTANAASAAYLAADCDIFAEDLVRRVEALLGTSA